MAGEGFNIAGDIAGAGVGIAQTISGAINLKKDKAALAALHPALYGIQSEYFQNRNLASVEAGGGLTAAAKNYETTEAQRGLGSSFSALTKTGANPNDISKLLDTYGRSIDRTAAEDADLQLKNIRYFMDVNKELAGQKTMKWAINEYQPYQEKLKQLTENIKGDKSNIWGGVGTAIGATTALGTSLSNSSLLKSQKGANDAQSAFYNKLFSQDGNIPDPFTNSMSTKRVTPEGVQDIEPS